MCDEDEGQSASLALPKAKPRQNPPAELKLAGFVRSEGFAGKVVNPRNTLPLPLPHPLPADSPFFNRRLRFFTTVDSSGRLRLAALSIPKG